jgi:hypothetical protein
VVAAGLGFGGNHAARPARLTLLHRGERTVVWRAADARDHWAPGDTILAGRAEWRPVQAGVEWAELELEGRMEARRTRVVAVRFEPARVRLELQNGMGPGGGVPTWAVNRAPDNALVALNAGQFLGNGAWGWVVHDGVEYRPPGSGPLALAVVVDSSGGVHFWDDRELAQRRGGGLSGVREAFQSYPALLRDGVLVPATGTRLGHRDARIAIGADAGGRVVIALSRFDVLGEALGVLPFGLTVPETAAVMASLGCRTAVALDGGISAQLLVRDPHFGPRLWPGLRAVPLGLAVLP